jgi:hypothetical protein
MALVALALFVTLVVIAVTALTVATPFVDCPCQSRRWRTATPLPRHGFASAALTSHSLFFIGAFPSHTEESDHQRKKQEMYFLNLQHNF